MMRRSSMLIAFAVVSGSLLLAPGSANGQKQDCSLHEKAKDAGRTFYAMKQAIEQHNKLRGAAPEQLKSIEALAPRDSSGNKVSLDSKQHDYEFRYEKRGTGWNLRATPLDSGKGCGSFFVDESGVIRFRREPGEASVRDSAHLARVVVGGNIQRERLLRQVSPEYPAEAKARGIRGTVLLQIVVGRDGQVDTIAVMKGDPILAKAAVEAVRQWRYEIVTLNGIPVEVATAIEVQFGP